MPFVAINCGALPENLIESELFGHRKGAFTGADEHRVGLFEVANGGTIFLDEIGELPKAMQAKLLRVLESGEIRRVGENEPFDRRRARGLRHAPRPAARWSTTGEFREDLMFRINTFEIHLPPLRERIDDMPELARHLLRALPPRPRRRRRAVHARGASTLLQDARLAGQRPRAGQRDRARHDPVRRAARSAASTCRSGSTAAQLAAPQLQDVRAVRRCARSKCRRSTDAWSATAATSPRPPTNSASASRRSTTS